MIIYPLWEFAKVTCIWVYRILKCSYRNLIMISSINNYRVLILIFNFLKTFSFEKFILIFKFLLPAYLLSKLITKSITFFLAQIVPLIPSLAKLTNLKDHFHFLFLIIYFLDQELSFLEMGRKSKEKLFYNFCLS